MSELLMDAKQKAIFETVKANADALDESLRERIKLWREQRARASAGGKSRLRRGTWVTIALICAGFVYEAAARGIGAKGFSLLH